MERAIIDIQALMDLVFRDQSPEKTIQNGEHVLPEICFSLTVRVYGDQPAPFILYADDGLTSHYATGQQNQLHLIWKSGEGQVQAESG